MGNKITLNTAGLLVSLFRALKDGDEKNILSPALKRSYDELKVFGSTPEEIVLNACLGKE